MLVFIPFLFLAFVFQGEVDALAKCTGLELVTCAFLVDGDKDSKPGMAETDEELNAKCKHALPILKCLNDFSINCPSPELERVGQFFQDEYAMSKRICDQKDPIRKSYLDNAKCLNKHRIQTTEKCGALLEFEEAETFTKDHCLAYENSYKCAAEEIQKNCGDGALNFEKEIWSPVNKFMKRVCQNFEYSLLKYLKQVPHKSLNF